MDDVLADWNPKVISILVRDNFRCVYCGLDGTQNVNAFRQLICGFDHLVPRGHIPDEDNVDNLVTCCWACNRAKSGYDPACDSDREINDVDKLRKARIQRARNELVRREHLSQYFERALTALRARSDQINRPSAAEIGAALDQTTIKMEQATTGDAAEAALGEQSALIADLIQTEALTFNDLYVKAKATAWAVDETEEIDPLQESNENARLCASLVRDIIKMHAERQPPHCRDHGRDGRRRTAHDQ